MNMLIVKPKDVAVLKTILELIVQNPGINLYQIPRKSKPRLDRITVTRKIKSYHLVENKYLRHKRGKRRSHCYFITLRGLILALKLKAVKPYAATEALKRELDTWFKKGIKTVRTVYGKKTGKKYRNYVDLYKPIIYDHIELNPKDFCNFLTRFDLDFCTDYEGPWSIFFEIFVFLLVRSFVDKSFRERLYKDSLDVKEIATELLSSFE